MISLIVFAAFLLWLFVQFRGRRRREKWRHRWAVVTFFGRHVREDARTLMLDLRWWRAKRGGVK